MAGEFKGTMLDFTKTVDPGGPFGELIPALEAIADAFSASTLSGERFFKLCVTLDEIVTKIAREHADYYGRDD